MTTMQTKLEAWENEKKQLAKYADLASDLDLDINEPQTDGIKQQIADRAKRWCELVTLINANEE